VRVISTCTRTCSQLGAGVGSRAGLWHLAKCTGPRWRL